MTSEKLYEILADIDDGYIKEVKEAREMKNSKIIQLEDRRMKRRTFKRPAILIATLLLGACLLGVTAFAASGKLRGFFKDIIRWDGTVVGTAYENATDEIELEIAEVADELVLKVNFASPDAAPYKYLETLSIGDYKIVDMNDKIVVKGTATETAEIIDGTTNIYIPLEGIAAGEYRIMIGQIIGGKKADQPLGMSGTWNVMFSIE